MGPTDSEKLKLEISDRDLKILTMWYQAIKNKLFYDNMGEFLIEGMRRYMEPYMKLVTSEHLKMLETKP